MADFKKYFPTLVKWEGSAFENVPGDAGGPTKFGVILSEWIAQGYDKNGDGKINVEDLKIITSEDAMKIAKPHYWDKAQADNINNQSVAEMIIDFGYNCGIGLAIRKTQTILNLTVDGSIGPNSIKAINNSNQKDLFDKLVSSRIAYYKAIVAAKPSQSKFLKGWLDRTNSFKFVA